MIAMRPDCLVLDEATAMLDPRGREKVMETIRRLNRDFGITVAAITHYMDEAARADRVLVMSEGRVVWRAPQGEVFRQTERMQGCTWTCPRPPELCW